MMGHGFPMWFMLLLFWWPLLLGVLLGVVGQFVWWRIVS